MIRSPGQDYPDRKKKIAPLRVAAVPTAAAPKRGKFIVFEGIDGTGKTTMSVRLATLLGAEWTREPDGECREALAGCTTPAQELAVFTLDRVIHCTQKIEPWLAAGKTVICDRYVWSTLAYQGAAFDAVRHSRDATIAMYEWLPKPDLVLYFEPTDVDVLLARAKGGDLTQFENRERMLAAAGAYESALIDCQPNALARIPSNLLIGDTLDAVMNAYLAWT